MGQVRAARMLQLNARQHGLLRSAAAGDPAAVDGLTRALDDAPVRLSAEVLSTKRVGADAGVSYGHTHVTGAPTTLALVYLGYGHGLPRKAGNTAQVTWAPDRGDSTPVRLSIVGRVAMDVLVVDAGELDVTAGDHVVLFGDAEVGEISLAEWAATVVEHPVSLLASFDARVTTVVSS